MSVDVEHSANLILREATHLHHILQHSSTHGHAHLWQESRKSLNPEVFGSGVPD